jgi:hypothetical protein
MPAWARRVTSAVALILAVVPVWVGRPEACLGYEQDQLSSVITGVQMQTL